MGSIRVITGAVSALAWLFLPAIGQASATQYQTAVSVEYGANVFGSSVGIFLRRDCGKWIAIGVGLSQAQYALVHRNNETLFWFDTNKTGYDLYEIGRIHSAGELFVSIGPTAERRLRLLNPFELGFGQFVGTLEMKYNVPGEGIFESERHYSDFHMYISWTIIEYHPEIAPSWVFGAGGRLRLAHLKVPFYQYAVNQEGVMQTIYVSDDSGNGWILFPIGDYFVRVGYKF